MFFSNFFLGNLTSEVGPHRPRSEIKYQQKADSGEVLNLFLCKDQKTTLTFCQVIILLYTSSRLTESSTLPPFWPAGFILPRFIENLLIYFFQYGPFGSGVGQASFMAPRILWNKLCMSISENTAPMFYNDDYRHKFENIVYQKYWGIECFAFDAYDGYSTTSENVDSDGENDDNVMMVINTILWWWWWCYDGDDDHIIMMMMMMMMLWWW